MAIGFTPKHSAPLPLQGITPTEFLVVASQTVTGLGWKVALISEHGLIAYTDNGRFHWNGEIRVKIETDQAMITSSSTGNDLADFGKNKENVEKFISVFHETRSQLNQADVTHKYEELKKEFVSPEEDILQLPPATGKDHFRDFVSIFLPTKGFFVTPILINLNLLVFILMVLNNVDILSPDSNSLISWGANFRPVTLQGEWWRLFSSLFLHIGIMHLLLNLYALLYIGVILEPLLGRSRFIAAYLLAGLTASITSLWWHDTTVSAGASGAIFGLYGVFLALLTSKLIDKSARQTMLPSIGIFVGYNLLFGLKGGIDNAAHIGGLVGGIVVGYSLLPGLLKRENKALNYLSAGSVAALIIGGSMLVYSSIPNDIVDYDNKLKQFFKNEELALEFYRLPEKTSKDVILSTIKDKGIPAWYKNLEILESAGTLKLPEKLVRRNQLLKEYCTLRLKSYELLYMAVADSTRNYKQDIESLDRAIQDKMDEITKKE